MKYSDLLKFSDVYNKLKQQEMPIATAYKLAKLSKLVLQELEFYNEAINKILMLYAEKDNKGKFKMSEDNMGVLIKEDYLIECNSKVQELNNMNIDIIITLTLDELGNFSLTPNDIEILLPFILE